MRRWNKDCCNYGAVSTYEEGTYVTTYEEGAKLKLEDSCHNIY